MAARTKGAVADCGFAGGPMTDVKSILIGALLVAVVVLGYMYWDRQRNTVEIKLPSVTIQKP
jgi:hypothetical protein